MNAKLVLCAALATLAAGCAGAPTWDTSVFPAQVSYGVTETSAPAAVAAAPAK